jgi:hypothetical protein
MLELSIKPTEFRVRRKIAIELRPQFCHVVGKRGAASHRHCQRGGRRANRLSPGRVRVPKRHRVRKALEAAEWSNDQDDKEARKRFITIEDGFAAAMGEEAIKQLQEVRSREDNAFDKSGAMARIGYYYDWRGKLAPIGYQYFGEELLSDGGQLEWRQAQANVYERLQKVRDFVERSGGVVDDTKWPSWVRFGLPEELFIIEEAPNGGRTIIMRSADGKEKVWTKLEALMTGEAVRIRPIDFPHRRGGGIGFRIDLVSIGDDELELISRFEPRPPKSAFTE